MDGKEHPHILLADKKHFHRKDEKYGSSKKVIAKSVTKPKTE